MPSIHSSLRKFGVVGWNTKLLSLAGRVTLSKSVLCIILSYFMQLALILIGVCVEIEKIIKKFVWGASSNDRKISLIGWDKFCMPMDRGGLGFQNIQSQNKAFLLKLRMFFINNKEALWVRVMRSKYKVVDRFT